MLSSSRLNHTDCSLYLTPRREKTQENGNTRKRMALDFARNHYPFRRKENSGFDERNWSGREGV